MASALALAEPVAAPLGHINEVSPRGALAMPLSPFMHNV